MSVSLCVNIWLSVPKYMYMVFIMVYSCAFECVNLLLLVVALCPDHQVDALHVHLYLRNWELGH